MQATALAEVIAEGGYRTVALMSPNDDYGRGFTDVLSDQLRANGIQVTISFAYDPNGTNFAPDVRRVLETDPEAIAVIGLPDTGGLVLRKLIDLGAGPDRLPTFVPDGLRVPNLYQRVDPTRPESTAGIHGTAVASVPESTAAGFADEFAAFSGGSADTFASYAYDCATILALAAQATRSDDPSLLRDEIINVTRGGVACRSFSDCKRLLDLGRNIDYEGASGSARPHGHRRPESRHLRRVRLQPGRHQHDRAPGPGQPVRLRRASSSSIGQTMPTKNRPNSA